MALSPAVKYVGSMTVRGDTVKLDITAGSSGLLYGSVALAGKKAQLLAVDGRTFLRASQSFWAETGISRELTPLVGRRWAEVENDLLEVDLARNLAPDRLGIQLHAALRSIAGEGVPSGPVETVNGTQAVKIRIPSGSAYVSAAGPHRIVRLNKADGTTGSKLAVDVTQLDEQGSERLQTRAATSARKLNGAYTLRAGARIDLAVEVDFGSAGAEIVGIGRAPNGMRIEDGHVRAIFYGSSLTGQVLDPPAAGVEPTLKFDELATCSTRLPATNPGAKFRVTCFAESSELTYFILSAQAPSEWPVPWHYVVRMRGLAFGIGKSDATALSLAAKEPLCKGALPCTVKPEHLPFEESAIANEVAKAINRALRNQTLYSGDGAAYEDETGLLPPNVPYRQWSVDEPDRSEPPATSIVVAGRPDKPDAIYFLDAESGLYVRIL